MTCRNEMGWPRVCTLLCLAVFLLGCDRRADAGEDSGGTRQEAAPMHLGPKDGFDLPPTELERVAVGTVAPDFSLPTLAGDTITLSEFRGVKDVVLVFYRGHW
jgi:hypothetical protein